MGGVLFYRVEGDGMFCVEKFVNGGFLVKDDGIVGRFVGGFLILVVRGGCGD